MSLKASRLLGGGIHGVDIMRSITENNRPYIIESNSCPGLAGVEAVTGENVAGAIIQYIMENYRKGGKRKETGNDGATAHAAAPTVAKQPAAPKAAPIDNDPPAQTFGEAFAKGMEYSKQRKA